MQRPAISEPGSLCKYAHTGTYSIADNDSAATVLGFFSDIYHILHIKRLYSLEEQYWSAELKQLHCSDCEDIVLWHLRSEGSSWIQAAGLTRHWCTPPHWAIHLLLVQFKQSRLVQNNIPTREETACWKWVKLLIMINLALSKGKPASRCTRPYSCNKEGCECREGVSPCRGERWTVASANTAVVLPRYGVLER